MIPYNTYIGKNLFYEQRAIFLHSNLDQIQNSDECCTPKSLKSLKEKTLKSEICTIYSLLNKSEIGKFLELWELPETFIDISENSSHEGTERDLDRENILNDTEFNLGKFTLRKVCKMIKKSWSRERKRGKIREP